MRINLIVSFNRIANVIPDYAFLLTALNEVYWNVGSTKACLHNDTNTFCAILDMSGSDKGNAIRSDKVTFSIF